MPYDMRIRAGSGWMNMTDMVAIRNIRKLVWEFTTTRQAQQVNRNHTQSLADYTDFNGRNFIIFGQGGFTGPRSGFISTSIIWTGGTRVVSGSSFQANTFMLCSAIGTYRAVLDLYIVET